MIIFSHNMYIIPMSLTRFQMILIMIWASREQPVCLAPYLLPPLPLLLCAVMI